jgi:hypothetical protein
MELTVKQLEVAVYYVFNMARIRVIVSHNAAKMKILIVIKQHNYINRNAKIVT